MNNEMVKQYLLVVVSLFCVVTFCIYLQKRSVLMNSSSMVCTREVLLYCVKQKKYYCGVMAEMVLWCVILLLFGNNVWCVVAVLCIVLCVNICMCV